MKNKKTYSQKRAPRTRKPSNPIEGCGDFPERLRKENCIYIKGVIDKAVHGIYHVTGENEMQFICTARRMEALKVGLITGDKVCIEIPLLGLEANAERQRARLVWRFRS